jgi:hypothetical protein
MTAAAKLLPDMDAKSADRYWVSMTRDTQVPTASVLGKDDSFGPAIAKFSTVSANEIP